MNSRPATVSSCCSTFAYAQLSSACSGLLCVLSACTREDSWLARPGSSPWPCRRGAGGACCVASGVAALAGCAGGLASAGCGCPGAAAASAAALLLAAASSWYMLGGTSRYSMKERDLRGSSSGGHACIRQVVPRPRSISASAGCPSAQRTAVIRSPAREGAAPDTQRMLLLLQASATAQTPPTPNTHALAELDDAGIWLHLDDGAVDGLGGAPRHVRRAQHQQLVRQGAVKVVRRAEHTQGACGRGPMGQCCEGPPRIARCTTYGLLPEVCVPQVCRWVSARAHRWRRGPPAQGSASRPSPWAPRPACSRSPWAEQQTIACRPTHAVSWITGAAGSSQRGVGRSQGPVAPTMAGSPRGG